MLEPDWSTGNGSKPTGRKGANGHRGGVISITQTATLALEPPYELRYELQHVQVWVRLWLIDADVK